MKRVMNHSKAVDLKKIAITDYLSIIEKWKWTDGVKTKRELERMGYAKVRDELTKLQAKREDIIMKLNEQPVSSDKPVIRPSGLRLTRSFQVGSRLIDYNKLLREQKPNQVIKVVVDRDSFKEAMLLKDFI